MNPQQLVNIIQNYEYYTRPYSGRFMYGKHCLGVVLSDGQTVSDAILNIIGHYLNNDEGVEDEELLKTQLELLELLKNSKTDSLGHDTIWYFPNIPWEENFESDEYEEDE